MKKEKILVIDDDNLIRTELEDILSPRGYEVILASSGKEGLEKNKSEFPHMIILDLSLPDTSGFEVCREIRKFSKIPILIISIHTNEFDKISALDIGADDYITKPFNTGEFLARIRAHLRRAKDFSDNKIFELKGLKISPENCSCVKNNELVKLTKTEYSLLEYLFNNKGKLVTYKTLLTYIWGVEYENDLKTLRVHIGNLRKKIETDPDNPEFLITEPGLGYRLVE